jgi:hypothetical protein
MAAATVFVAVVFGAGMVAATRLGFSFCELVALLAALPL